MLPAERRMHVGERVEKLELDAAEFTPLGEACLGKQHVGEQRRLAVADAVADEDRRAPPPTSLLDRRLLARAAAGARATAIEVRELEGARGPVDGVGEQRDTQPGAHLLGVEA